MRANRIGVLAFSSAIAAFALPLYASAAVVPGTSPGNFSVGASGAAQYALPLTLPPGVRGISPQLSFQYSSQGDNGLLGVGWALGGLQTINRCPQTLPQDGARTGITAGANDRFCLNGQRLILVSGTYGANGAEYRTELDTFSRIISYTSVAARGPDSFKVWTKDGQIIEFGNTTDSKLVATQTTSVANSSATYGYVNTVSLSSNQTVLQWNANKVSDRKSNFYTISYTKTDLTGEIYPSSISYTGNDTAGQTLVSPTNTVVFSYEARPTLEDNLTGADYPLQYLGGSKVLPGKRLKEVAVSADGVLARKYKLAYKGVETWGAMRSRLDTVTECAFDAAGAESCFSPTRFDMSAFSGCMYDSYKSTLATAATVGAGTYIPLAQDFDGDGRTDLVSVKIDTTGFRVLSSKSGNAVPSGTDFSDTTTCATAIKQGQSFDATGTSAVTTTNHGASTNWSVTSGDINGDGLPEVVAIPLAGALNPVVAVRQTNGAFSLGTSSVSDTSNYSGTTHNNYGGERAWLVDVDGDGKQDVVAIKLTGVTVSNTNVAVFYRKGNGDGTFAQTVRQDLTIGLNDSPLGFNNFMGDVDGDGRADLVFARLRSGVIMADALRGVGTGSTVFQASVGSSLIQQSKFDNALASGTVTRISLLDVNRDGLSDLVFFKVLKGTGSTDPNFNKGAVLTALAKSDGSFVAVDASLAQVTAGPLINTTSDLSTIPWRTTFTDINGDGRVDLFVSHVLGDANYSPAKNRLLVYTFLNRGDGRLLLAGAGWSTNAAEPSLATEANWARVSGDFDGDGLGDLASVQVNSTSGYLTFPIFARSPLPDLITKVTDGNGAVTAIVQAPLTRDEVYTKGTSTFPKVALRAPLYVVKTVARDSGNSLAPANWTYAYGGAAVDVGGRGFLGFASQAVTDPLGIVTTTTFSQTFPYTGMATNVSVKKGASTLSSVANTPAQKIITHASGKSSYFPFVASSVAHQYEYTSTSLTSQTSTTNNLDTWGNVLSSVATTTGDGSTYTQTTTNSYFPNTINATTWRIGELSQKADRRTGPLPGGATSDITRTVAWTYDTAGLMATEVVEPANNPLKTTTTVTRDRFGNVLSSSVAGVDIVTRGESAAYDASGRFVISKTNAEGHVTAPIVTDKRFGLPLSIKDANGTYSIRQYDNFGRVTREQIKETNTSGAVLDGPYTDTAYLLCDATCVTAQGEAFIVRVTRQGVAPAFVYYDRNGRERRKVVKAMDSSDIVTATEYDALGRVARTSKPYFASSSPQWASRAYDAIGRLSSETLPGARTTTYAYNARVTSATNPKTQVTQKTNDALGRLVTTTDAASKVQSFAYDAFGNVVRSTDAKNNLIINQYDLLGRKTQQQDPDLGTWTYQYNVLGQLVQQQDAKGQVTTFTYDKLDRPRTRAEPDLNSIWTWDTATKGIGKLAKLTGDNGFERTYSYDGFGRPVQSATKKTIDPNAQAADPDFVYSTTFDTAGRPASVTYPTGFGYKNVYDANGYLSEVRHKGSNALYWRANTRDAEGHVTRETLGNGLVTDRKYKVDTSYLDTVQTGTLSGSTLTASVQNDVYGFDAIGNLTSRSLYFGSTSLTETFGYDSLNRVTTITPVSGTVKTAAYDVIGNIINRSDVGVYSYTGCGGTHRVCNIAGAVNSAFSYDANGNMTAGNGRSLTWTSTNYPLQITQGATTESFLYSPERERVRRTSVENGQTTTSVYLNPRIDLGGTFEKTRKPDGSTEYTHHVYAGGQVIGSVVTTGALPSGIVEEPPEVHSNIWSSALSSAPTTQNPNGQGVTLPASDPNGLIAWNNPGSDGRLELRFKPQATGMVNALGQTRVGAGDVVLSAEVTTPTFVAGQALGGIAFVGVNNKQEANLSATDHQYHLLYIGSQQAMVIMKNPSGGSDIFTNLLRPDGSPMQLQSNTTYTLVIETTETSSRLSLYPKGQTVSAGGQHIASINWRGPGLVNERGLMMSSYSMGSAASMTAVGVDNLAIGSSAWSGETNAYPGDTRYFHMDHLSSATAVTNEAGAVIERLSYDAWGKRRNPDGSDDKLATVAWATGLSTAPTTANPNSTGLTLPSTTADPNGLITWDNSTGDGRLAIRTTTNPTTTGPAIRRQSSYLNENVTFRGEVTPTANVGSNGRYLLFRVYNSGTSTAPAKTSRYHSLYLRGNNTYASTQDGITTVPATGNLSTVTTNLNYPLTPGTTYVVEIETTPTSSVLYLYKKGETRALGVRHAAQIDWRTSSGTYKRYMLAYAYSGPTEADNVTYLDNLSETVWSVQNTLQGQTTKRGYTLHEHLDSIGLVHMNGRVYDPLVGRFMSADPNVFYPENQQDFNRYSYVHNNPLSFVDPSGFALIPLSDTYMSNYLVQNTISQMEISNMMARVERGSMTLGTTNYASLNVSSSSSRPAVTSNQHGGSGVTVGNGSGSSGSASSGQRPAQVAGNTGQSSMRPLSDGELSSVWGAGISGGDSGSNFRSLTPGEIQMARPVFGDKIDYSIPLVYGQKYVPWQPERMAISPNGNMYFHPNDYMEDFSKGTLGEQTWFIHEMTHVMQSQHGVNVFGSGLMLQAGKYMSFGIYDPYRFEYDPTRPFSSYNIEQQGDYAEGIFNKIYPNTIDYKDIKK